MKVETQRFLLVAVLLMAITLTACGYDLETGVIIDKRYTPARTMIHSTLIGSAIVPQYIITPPIYEICVQGQNEEGAITSEWWSVDAVEYGRCNAGMAVTRKGDRQ